MDQKEEPEFGRFDHKSRKDEPIEPFFQEEKESEWVETPFLSSLHIPKPPINEAKLKGFLIELKDIIQEIQQMSRRDQHKVGVILQELKNHLHAEKTLPREIIRIFEKIADHFNSLLVHSTPLDQEKIQQDIQELESKL